MDVQSAGDHFLLQSYEVVIASTQVGSAYGLRMRHLAHPPQPRSDSHP